MGRNAHGARASVRGSPSAASEVRLFFERAVNTSLFASAPVQRVSAAIADTCHFALQSRAHASRYLHSTRRWRRCGARRVAICSAPHTLLGHLAPTSSSCQRSLHECIMRGSSQLSRNLRPLPKVACELALSAPFASSPPPTSRSPGLSESLSLSFNLLHVAVSCFPSY